MRRTGLRRPRADSASRAGAAVRPYRWRMLARIGPAPFRARPFAHSAYRDSSLARASPVLRHLPPCGAGPLPAPHTHPRLSLTPSRTDRTDDRADDRTTNLLGCVMPLWPPGYAIFSWLLMDLALAVCLCGGTIALVSDEHLMALLLWCTGVAVGVNDVDDVPLDPDTDTMYRRRLRCWDAVSAVCAAGIFGVIVGRAVAWACGAAVTIAALGGSW